MIGSEVSSTWKFSHSGIPTGSFQQFEQNNITLERETADGGINSIVENDKEENYYYTTPISQHLSQPDNLKTRSIGEGRSASSSPLAKCMQSGNLQNRVKQSQPDNLRWGIFDYFFYKLYFENREKNFPK